jgi:hypothetical protein
MDDAERRWASPISKYMESCMALPFGGREMDVFVPVDAGKLKKNGLPLILILLEARKRPEWCDVASMASITLPSTTHR